MSNPFQAGDAAALLQLEGDAVRVYSTTVREAGEGYVIDDKGGRHEVDGEGESPDLVPVNDFLAHELRVKGEGFHIYEEGRERDPWEIQPPEIGGDIGD